MLPVLEQLLSTPLDRLTEDFFTAVLEEISTLTAEQRQRMDKNYVDMQIQTMIKLVSQIVNGNPDQLSFIDTLGEIQEALLLIQKTLPECYDASISPTDLTNRMMPTSSSSAGSSWLLALDKLSSQPGVALTEDLFSEILAEISGLYKDERLLIAKHYAPSLLKLALSESFSNNYMLNSIMAHLEIERPLSGQVLNASEGKFTKSDVQSVGPSQPLLNTQEMETSPADYLTEDLQEKGFIKFFDSLIQLLVQAGRQFDVPNSVSIYFEENNFHPSEALEQHIQKICQQHGIDSSQIRFPSVVQNELEEEIGTLRTTGAFQALHLEEDRRICETQVGGPHHDL